MSNSTEISSIDQVIHTCEEKIVEHRLAGTRILILIVLVLVAFVAIILWNMSLKREVMNDAVTYSKEYTVPVTQLAESIHKYIYSQNADTAHINGLVRATIGEIAEAQNKYYSSAFETDTTTTYIGYGVFILVFSVLISFYRFRVKEVSKYEHFLFGFHRIRIAGNNSALKFDDEVRTSLTKDAFTVEQSKSLISKTAKVESPIPGYLPSDTLTILLNKVLDGSEIVVRKKG